VLVGKTDSDLLARYIFLSGCYCLLKYIENCNGNAVASHSLRIQLDSSVKERMIIDRSTAEKLELVRNKKSGNKYDCLFGVIDFTKTSVGTKLLKSNILQPLTSILSLTSRTDAVEILLR
jgi:DNA mismatch repair protein MSH4